jgi:protein-S-isoprenylcysteine O-methyltransferase Ste14
MRTSFVEMHLSPKRANLEGGTIETGRALSDLLRIYFLLFYTAGVAIIALRVLPAVLARTRVEARPTKLRAYLPFVLIPFQWLLPPIIIFFRIGELSIDAPALRLLGLAVGLYAAALLLWAPLTLGRFLVPYAVVFRDHELVTSGPFRFMRHPVYSGNLALFLGSALGTLNIYLLLLWPTVMLSFVAEARIEERLLRDRFGAVYDAYAARAGLLLPRLSGRSKAADRSD